MRMEKSGEASETEDRRQYEDGKEMGKERKDNIVRGSCKEEPQAKMALAYSNLAISNA